MELLRACGEMTIMVMGGSFILGSLFTVFLLLVLDMLKAQRMSKKDGGSNS